VYRPEADVEGDDLVLFTPSRELIRVQLKGRPHVDLRRYGNIGLWLLFPSAKFKLGVARTWFLIPHDDLFGWIKDRHGHTPKWGDWWSYPTMSVALRSFLADRVIGAPADENSN